MPAPDEFGCVDCPAHNGERNTCNLHRRVEGGSPEFSCPQCEEDEEDYLYKNYIPAKCPLRRGPVLLRLAGRAPLAPSEGPPGPRKMRLPERR